MCRAVRPGTRFTIVFPKAIERGTAVVSLTDGFDVVVRAPVGAAAFTSDPERLIVEARDLEATVEILLPRDAPEVTVLVAGRRVFHKLGARVTATGLADTATTFPLALSAVSHPP